MNIQIQSIHFSPSEALNEKIEKKLQKVFGKYTYAKRAEVFLKYHENAREEKYDMEIKVALKHAELFAETREDDYYKALDKNMLKLKRQLEKYKEKTYAHL